jgi:hypothetical protein
MRWTRYVAVFVFALLACEANAQAPTDDQIRSLLIQQSIEAYPGNCPCPYSRASNGSRCGKRSAWSKAGGYAPLCYPEDVTTQMVDQFRRTHGG